MKASLYVLLGFASLIWGLTSQLRLLAFGDSLTAGFTNWGGSRHPYTGVLKATLEEKFPKVNVTTNQQGQSGDHVISPPGQFLPRMETLFSEATIPYTYAIILGGTNDLNINRRLDEIWTALEAVWAIPLTNGTKVLALTVPEEEHSPTGVFARRKRLNNLILNYQAPGFYTLDLCKLIPYFAMPVEERRKIWDDGLHFTPRGYDLVGSLIAARIIEIEATGALLGIKDEDGKNELRRRDDGMEV